MNVVLLELGLSNLGSLREALRTLGVTCTVSDSKAAVNKADILVLPGVGAFAEGMAALHRKNLVQPLRDYARSGNILLGICLGMQLLLDSSEENGFHQGLGIVSGNVLRLKRGDSVRRIPHIGWTSVVPCLQVAQKQLLLRFLNPPENFYFLHSYACHCMQPAASIATFDFGYPVTAALACGNVYGVQFHPEKSQDAGLNLLDHFFRSAGVPFDL